MALKTQDSRVYRGLLWVARAYRLAGWLGLGATAFWTLVMFFHQYGVFLSRPSFMTGAEALQYALLAAFIVLIIGLSLTAVAFALSLAIQVGLVLNKNSRIKTDLLRRLAQEHDADRLQRLSEPADMPAAAATAGRAGERGPAVAQSSPNAPAR
ncbi:MAG: hypothetical protein MUE40_19775 [Anaerolineae bacterium]|nr:hypothetical protein [Anaerolineae bacterium]